MFKPYATPEAICFARSNHVFLHALFPRFLASPSSPAGDDWLLKYSQPSKVSLVCKPTAARIAKKLSGPKVP